MCHSAVCLLGQQNSIGEQLPFILLNFMVWTKTHKAVVQVFDFFSMSWGYHYCFASVRTAGFCFLFFLFFISVSFSPLFLFSSVLSVNALLTLLMPYVSGLVLFDRSLSHIHTKWGSGWEWGVCNAPSVLCWISFFKKDLILWALIRGVTTVWPPLNSQELQKKKKEYRYRIHTDCHFYIPVHYLLIPFIKTKSHSLKKGKKNKQTSQVRELLSTWKSFLKFCKSFTTV